MKKLVLTLLLGVTTLTAFAQVPSNVPTNGLVGYWPFNGNANDESGNGNNGTVNGATLTTDRNGVANKAYSFDGISNVISTNRVSLNTFSFSGWYNLNEIQTYSPIIDAYNATWEVLINSSKPNFVKWIASPGTYNENICTNISNNVNQWYHIVSIYSSNKVDIYINGFYVQSFTNIILSTSNGSYNFGASISGSTQYLNGKLDDFGIWNRALNQQEITALYTGCTTPTATITPQSSTTFCQNGSVVLNASTGTGYAYEWYKDGTIINGSTTSSYTAIQSGSYTVKVINGSCNATSTVTDVLANPNPTAVITPQSTTTFCQGGSVVLNASTGSGNTYVWYKDGNIINGSIGSSYTVIQSGSYTVKVINGSCNATSTVTDVLVYPNPTVSFTTLASYTDYQHSPITLLATPSGGIYSGPGVSGSIFDPSIAGLGKKTVTYNVTNSNNCSGSAFQSTIVNDTLGVVCTAYDTITVTDTLLITTTLGLSNQTSNTIKIYPNPAKDHITINNGNFATMPNYTIRIDNALGQQVFLSAINQQSFYVDLSSWSGDGVYFVYLKDAQGTIKEIRKIVLQ